MRSTDWIDRSNKKAQEKRRWCEKHGWRAYWGKRDDGTWFDRCVIGNRINEDCVIGKD